MAKSGGKRKKKSDDAVRQQKLALTWDDASGNPSDTASPRDEPAAPGTSSSDDVVHDSAAAELPEKKPSSGGDEKNDQLVSSSTPLSAADDAAADIEEPVAEETSAADEKVETGVSVETVTEDTSSAPEEEDLRQAGAEEAAVSDTGEESREDVLREEGAGPSGTDDKEAGPVLADVPEPHAPSPVDMVSGEMLMAARADFGFSIEDVSSKTRIPRDIIENLECSAIEQLPAEYYCRSHIERLCELYNVDPEPILERFSAEVEAVRGPSGDRDHFRMTRHESESGAMIRPMPEGSGPLGKPGRRIRPMRVLVSCVIVLFLATALWALIALHLRNRRAEDGSETTAEKVQRPPVDLQEFIVPMQLDACELPIPDRPTPAEP